MAAFSGVRVEPADQDAWVGDAELVAHVGVQDARHALDALGGDGIGNIAQGQVRGHQGHTQAMGRQHHHHLSGVGQFGEELGMARKGDAALVDHALVHRGGDHPGEMPVEAALARTCEGLQDESGIGFVQLARHYGGGQGGIPDIQTAGRRGLVGPVRRRYRQQVDGQPQLCGPLGEQVTAGDGDKRMRLGVGGEQQAQVGTYAGRLAGGDGETQGLHCAAWPAPGSLIST
ncbi:hypothetical protein D3C79_528280 [compost metagenome]